ncbi:hypothetical protein [Arthrobacter cryoconiti]|uniref:Uncharacterized protein n=1 Tax=Arthrobacter cryoconiti TaxID=748907 RepID=A0ABV8R2Q7_9MICC|nr:hypothetical protein [Arthrobacter cryoconiti]MCC9069310.1 hypothetical protein [Arthrobacter cryoconiti]
MDTFADKPVIAPNRPALEYMTAFGDWFQAQTPERQEAYRQKIREENAEEES